MKQCLSGLMVALLLGGAGAQSNAPAFTLEECVRLALQRSPRLETSRHERELQLIQLDRERPSGLHPDLRVVASQTLTLPQIHFPNGAGPLVTPFARPALGLSFVQTVFHFGARRAEQRSHAVEKALNHQREKAEAEVILDVKRGYFNLQTALALHAVARAAVEQVDSHRKVAQSAVEAGTALPIDVKRAEIELANLQTGVVKAENGVALARANLNRLMGRGLDEPLTLAPPPPLPAPPAPLEAAVSAALKQRPELAALRASIQALETSVGLAKTQKLPSAAVRGAFLHQRDSAFTRSPSVVAALEFSMPIFDHKSSLDLREVRARLAQMRSQLTEAESGLALEVRQAWLNYQEARHRVGTLPGTIATAEESVRIAELRFANGRATYLEVTDAMLQSRRAKADLAQAESDLHIAAAEVEKAIGKR